MTNTPNMKPESVSTDAPKPTTGTQPQDTQKQDAQKTSPAQPHVEPAPAQKS